MTAKTPWAALLAAAFLIPAQADAASTVLGNGLAKQCWHHARDGADGAEALQTCTYALETEAMDRRDRAATFANRGILHLRRKDYADAKIDFNRAIKLRPDLGEAHVNRGAAYVGERRYDEAISEIDRGLQLGSEEPEKAYFNRALAHEGRQDMKAAYLDYLRALELRPDWEPPKKELRRFTVVSR